MGVPAFFRWLTKRFPRVVTDVIEDTEEKIDATKPNPNKIEFDNLYLDMNGIIHPCCHPEDGPQPANEDEMIQNVFKYIDRIFNMVRPRHLLYMAIDGVAPRAKMNQQRSRRFRAALDARLKKESDEKLREEWLAEGRTVPKKKAEAWDSNVITPGTPFMSKLSAALHVYIANRQSFNPAWKNIVVIFSDDRSPGEGEHKIMEFIRLMRACSFYNPNTRHCLYGMDADLIMLGLASHDPHFYIIREEVMPQTNKRCFVCNQEGHVASECTGAARRKEDAAPETRIEKSALRPFQFLHIPILREYLAQEFAMHNLPFKWDLERFLDDFVFMCFFVGNDFLPHLPSLEIREGAIEQLIRIYKRHLPSLGGYLSENGTLNMSRVDVLISELGTFEDGIFKRRKDRSDRDKHFDMKRKEERAAKAKAEKELAGTVNKKNLKKLGGSIHDKYLQRVASFSSVGVTNKTAGTNANANANVNANAPVSAPPASSPPAGRKIPRSRSFTDAQASASASGAGANVRQPPSPSPTHPPPLLRTPSPHRHVHAPASSSSSTAAAPASAPNATAGKSLNQNKSAAQLLKEQLRASKKRTASEAGVGGSADTPSEGSSSASSSSSSSSTTVPADSTVNVKAEESTSSAAMDTTECASSSSAAIKTEVPAVKSEGDSSSAPTETTVVHKVEAGGQVVTAESGEGTPVKKLRLDPESVEYVPPTEAGGAAEDTPVPTASETVGVSDLLATPDVTMEPSSVEGVANATLTTEAGPLVTSTNAEVAAVLTCPNDEHGILPPPEEAVDEELAEEEEKEELDFDAVSKLRDMARNAPDQADKVRLGEEGYQERYYYVKMGLDRHNQEDRAELTKLFHSYGEGLNWVMHYYYKGVASWGWFYPFHYAPMASDLRNLDRVPTIQTFEKGQPFSPLGQMLGVFPAATSHAVPVAAADLMLNANSPIIDFYPENFQLDLNGKRYLWQAVALLPWVDERRLQKAVASVEHSLTEEEKIRNTMGPDYIFVHREHPLANLFLSCYLDPKKRAALESGDEKAIQATRTEITLRDQPKVTHPIAGHVRGYVGAITPYSQISCDLKGLEPFTPLCISVVFENPPFAPHICSLKPGVVLPPRVLNEMDFHQSDRRGGPRFGHAPTFHQQRTQWESHETGNSTGWGGQMVYMQGGQGRGRGQPSAAGYNSYTPPARGQHSQGAGYGYNASPGYAPRNHHQGYDSRAPSPRGGYDSRDSRDGRDGRDSRDSRSYGASPSGQHQRSSSGYGQSSQYNSYQPPSRGPPASGYAPPASAAQGYRPPSSAGYGAPPPSSAPYRMPSGGAQGYNTGAGRGQQPYSFAPPAGAHGRGAPALPFAASRNAPSTGFTFSAPKPSPEAPTNRYNALR